MIYLSQEWVCESVATFVIFIKALITIQSDLLIVSLTKNLFKFCLLFHINIQRLVKLGNFIYYLLEIRIKNALDDLFGLERYNTVFEQNLFDLLVTISQTWTVFHLQKYPIQARQL